MDQGSYLTELFLPITNLSSTYFPPASHAAARHELPPLSQGHLPSSFASSLEPALVPRAHPCICYLRFPRLRSNATLHDQPPRRNGRRRGDRRTHAAIRSIIIFHVYFHGMNSRRARKGCEGRPVTSKHER